jgi:hypothetical protein
MSWIDLLDNNHFLRTLFPAGGPSLEAVRLHEVLLHQDGPSVSLRFDLNEYPARPPEKWHAAKGNVVQVRLAGVGVRYFALKGWAGNNIGTLILDEAAVGVVLEFDSGECRMTAAFDHLRIDAVTSYRDESGGRM